MKIELAKTEIIHFVGIGGIGMSGLALIMKGLGFKVHGSDISSNKNIERLRFLEDKVHRVSSVIYDLEKFDVIIEATGSKKVLEKILDESGFDSTILLLGFPYGDINYNFEKLVGDEKVIVGSVGAGEEDFKGALELLSKLDTEPFIQNIMPLSDFKKAWELHRSAKHLKILLKP